MKNLNFDKVLKRIKKPEKTNLKGEWQEYAIEVCKEFNLKPPYSLIIFKHAKHHLAYLKAKVENLRESPKYEELIKRNKAGHYLISMFRKNNK